MTKQELRADLADTPAIQRVLDALWPEAAPQQLLARFYAEPGRLGLTDAERAAVARDTPRPWTAADVPLLDELAELLGTLTAEEQAASRGRAEDEAERAEALQYARQLVADLVEASAIVVPPLENDTFVTWVADRNIAAASGGALAERASRDRTWAYGHVIVDEAQELSAMAWRMVLRRCPARSLTVVGDLAQTSAPGGADSWAQVLDPEAAGRWRTARLTVNYRTPAPAMALAAALLPPAVEPPLSVRDSAEPPWHARTEDLAGLVRRERELIGTGRVAVIAPPASVAATAATLGLSPGPDPSTPRWRCSLPGRPRGLSSTRSSWSTRRASSGPHRAAGRTCTSRSPGPPAGSGLSAGESCPPSCGPCSMRRRTGRGKPQPLWMAEEGSGATDIIPTRT